jgi:hypothetical protein
MAVMVIPGENPYVFSIDFFESNKDWNDFKKIADYNIKEAK